MKLFPAIDLVQGKAVRLFQGDYEKMTVYRDDPLLQAKDFRNMGAEYLHLVDLEGARDGTTPNFDAVLRIKAESGLFCEIGGGIRRMETVEKYLAAGLDRVILGTAAVEDPGFLREALSAFGEKIAVGVDLKDGFVAVRGWLKTTDREALSFCRGLEEMGLSTLICTDISRDGAMRGTNRELYRKLTAGLHLKLVASGGVSGMEDVLALKALGLEGAIIGKACYTGAIDLKRTIEAAK